MPKFCDSCLDAAYDEIPDADADIVELVLATMGELLPDHLCDRIETDGEIPCDCAEHVMPSIQVKREALLRHLQNSKGGYNNGNN